MHTMKFKVVVDTNLFVAAYYNPLSASAKVLDMIAKRDLIFVWTRDIKKEVEHILGNIKAKPKFAKKIFSKVFVPEHRHEPHVRIKEIREDREDNKFLEAAVAGEADFIITSDRHLLNLKKFNSIPIVTPNNFWKIIKQ